MLKNITRTKDVYGLCNLIRIKICVIREIRGTLVIKKYS